MLRRAKKRPVPEVDSVIPVASSKSTFKGSKLVKQDKLAEDEGKQEEVVQVRRAGRKMPTLGAPAPKTDSEEMLEKLVLGGQTSFVVNLQREDKEIGVLDRDERRPAWEDEEDDDVARLNSSTGSEEVETVLPVNTGAIFSQARKAQFEKVVGSTPLWATLHSKNQRNNEAEGEESDNEEDDEEERLLRRTGDYLTSSDSLPKSFLNVKKVTNANKEQYTHGRLCAMEFHPTSQVMLTAGEDQCLHIFQVDGKKNPKIQSVAMEQYPILSAHFSADGSEVIMSSRSRWYYVYDMMAGKIERISFLREYSERQPLCKFAVSPDSKFIAFQGLYGFIHLVSAKNKELICTMKMNGSVTSLAFSGDGTKLFSFGDDGEVYIWDMKTRDCIHKFVDDGCIKGSTISVSRGGHYVACGSQSGVVNIYNDQCLTEVRPKPIKAVMNLTTTVTATRFNNTSEILAASSFHSKSGTKLIHLPDCHIFPNFPLSADSIGLPTLLDFSPSSGYLAVGNSRGKALLYRLGHYKNY